MADVAADEPMSSQKLVAYARAGRSWVATDREDHVVGYVVVELIDGCAHIEQVSVEPGYQGQGLGRALGGRQVARIVPDPERAPLITGAFERYVTGDWTLQRLAGELAHQGLTNRGQRGKPAAPITWQGLAKILANPVYIGVVEWNGVQYSGTHEPLVTPEVFRRVQELLGARAARGTRERKHPHYLTRRRRRMPRRTWGRMARSPQRGSPEVAAALQQAAV
jgi:GNAT superfamily N-acetyltransferase